MGTKVVVRLRKGVRDDSPCVIILSIALAMCAIQGSQTEIVAQLRGSDSHCGSTVVRHNNGAPTPDHSADNLIGSMIEGRLLMDAR
jgi:hypothetical protein